MGKQTTVTLRDDQMELVEKRARETTEDDSKSAVVREMIDEAVDGFDEVEKLRSERDTLMTLLVKNVSE